MISQMQQQPKASIGKSVCFYAGRNSLIDMNFDEGDKANGGRSKR